ncbi:MAG TPA: acetyltransferase [Gammaproteobacteria bacterium]|nr:acetyltransferase [Gammaproteobacteria bacterium]HRF45845.1 acetyltransferase [Candidatus Competibacteraceae bacterium]
MAETDSQTLAEAIRAACISAALEAYEEGGVLGLCAEGRWEYAISTLQQLDLNMLIECNHTANQDDVVT